jgi:hypothetical protein
MNCCRIYYDFMIGQLFTILVCLTIVVAQPPEECDVLIKEWK